MAKPDQPKKKRTESPQTRVLRAHRELAKLKSRLDAAHKRYDATVKGCTTQREAILNGLSKEEAALLEKLS